MKILIVCSKTSQNIELMKDRPYIYEQVKATHNIDPSVKFEYYFITQKGILGYLSNIFPLANKIKREKYDIIHAHYGLSGLVAAMQRLSPVIITYHGSDINRRFNRFLSFIASMLSSYSIFVSAKLRSKLL